MIRVTFTVDDPAGLLATYGAGALLRVERAATEAGVYVEIGTVAIDAGSTEYTLWDPAGAATSWYRWRASDAGDTTYSAYSDAFQGSDAEDTSSERYAPLSAVLAGYQQTVPDDARTRLDNSLLDATDQISDLVGLAFFTGSAETWTINELVVSPSGLCVHDGIVSLTTVEVRSSVHSDWVELEANEWELVPALKSGYPSFHIRLTGIDANPRWPCGATSAVRLTGIRGWPAVPRSIRRATIDRARQLSAWDASRPGGVTGPEELGTGVGPNRMPDTMYRLKHDYSAWELGLAQCDL